MERRLPPSNTSLALIKFSTFLNSFKKSIQDRSGRFDIRHSFFNSNKNSNNIETINLIRNLPALVLCEFIKTINQRLFRIDKFHQSRSYIKCTFFLFKKHLPGPPEKFLCGVFIQK